jgi:hypothetical protein
MLGIRRMAVVATAFLFFSAAWAAAEAPPHVLPAGTAVIFVADGHLDAAPREGAQLVVHLRDPLVLDGTVVGAAGSRARLVVEYPAGAGGSHTPSVVLGRFEIQPGLMPVRPDRPIELPIETGATIAARTQADVDHVGDRFSIRVPFPFPLSGDKPAAYYTATPARTAPPRTLTPPGHRPGPPTPLPTAAPSPSGSPDAAALGSAPPSAAASPSPSP